MSHRFRDLLPPSCGDELLANATTAKITLSRWPADDAGESSIDCEFELRGQIPLTGDAAGDLLSALINEFRAKRRPQQEEGGAVC
jgi:hypothetical protein